MDTIFQIGIINAKWFHLNEFGFRTVECAFVILKKLQTIDIKSVILLIWSIFNQNQDSSFVFILKMYDLLSPGGESYWNAALWCPFWVSFFFISYPKKSFSTFCLQASSAHF